MKPLQIISVFASMAFVLFSCKSLHKNEIVIEGQVKDLPDGKVYLTDAYNWKIPLDSTQSHNGYFIFHWNPRTTNIPFAASISFPDPAYPAGVQQLLYRNHMRNDSMRHGSSAFYLDKGHTRIEGVLAKNQFLRVFGSKETDRFYKITMP